MGSQIKNGGLVTLVSLDGFVSKPRLFDRPECKNYIRNNYASIGRGNKKAKLSYFPRCRKNNSHLALNASSIRKMP